MFGILRETGQKERVAVATLLSPVSIHSVAMETNMQDCTTEYRCWTHMRQRCNNPNNDTYKYYGGRGIKVCERWSSFENFLADMGPKPSPELTLERINND